MSGISGFSVYLPPYRVHLKEWCDWNGQPWEKISAVIGDAFRVCAPDQDVYALAATAALRLIEAYDVDPGTIGMLALGTESASDNSAGAVIVRGLLDRALAARARSPLPVDCEVPELKHACLGGIYGVKQAARYLAADGAGRRAIVISADIAEYAPGSSGEPTQGAGAVAMLMDNEPTLLEVDLTSASSASSYREVDFRKPFARYAGQAPGNARLRDFPVFNGRYSTACFFDSVRAAFGGVCRRRRQDWLQTLAEWDAVFMHRPYARMPESAWGLLWLHALAADGDPAFAQLCAAADLPPHAVADELARGPDLAALRAAGRLDVEVYPRAQMLLRSWRRQPDYAQRVSAALGPGQDGMRELGNLYTAALPAWLAAACDALVGQQADVAGQQWLALGYGSGDAAEALPLRVMPQWRAAAKRIGFAGALTEAVDLDDGAYAALHAGGWPQAPTKVPAQAFVIDSIGESEAAHFADAGIAHYRYAD